MTFFEDRTNEFSPEEIKSNKGLSICAYLGILVLIPLFTKKKTAYMRFNLSQGLTLIAAKMFYLVFALIIGIIGFAISETVGKIVAVLLIIIAVALWLLFIFGIVSVASGKARTLPAIGNIKMFNV